MYNDVEENAVTKNLFDETKLKKAIGGRVKALREASKEKETQKSLADYLGVSKDTVSKVEQGVNWLQTAEAIKIAAKYEVSLDYLINGIDMNNDPNDTLKIICKYLKFGMQVITINHSHRLPFIAIHKDLFNFQKAMDKASELKKDNVPEEVIGAWVDKKKSEMLDSIRNLSEMEFLAFGLHDDEFYEFALLSYKHISDEVAENIVEAYRNNV